MKAWLDGGSPNDNDKRRYEQTYAGLTDDEIKARLYPYPPESSALDTELAETDFEQFDTFDDLIAFCRASVLGVKTTS